MGAMSPSPAVTPFQVELPSPPVLKPGVYRDPKTGRDCDLYQITARRATARILPGRDTEIWGYDGHVPGPTIVARQGRPVVLRISNELPEETVLHLHGGHVPPESDGQMMDPILPGKMQELVYPNIQDASTLWYHTHVLHRTGQQVYRGLAAFYILTDDFEDKLPLPKGEYDVAFVIQDRLFTNDGSFNYALARHSIMHGLYGDTILVNGAVQPFLPVSARKYRLRILNGSNARPYELRLSSGDAFVQIASDGGLLPAPVRRESMLMGPAERIEVVVDFGAYPVGTKIVLKDLLAQGGRTEDILRFDVVRKANDDSSVPAVLRPMQPLQAAEAVRTRRWVLGMNMGMGMGMGRGMGRGMMGGGGGSGGPNDLFTINGLSHGHGRVDAYPTLDDVEIWEYVNPMMMWHPMHCHNIFWQTLDRNGRPPEPWEAGWKDTWFVPPGGAVRVIGKFSDFTSSPAPEAHTDYMMHCHNLEHKDHGMMTAFRVLAKGVKPPAPGGQEHRHVPGPR